MYGWIHCERKRGRGREGGVHLPTTDLVRVGRTPTLPLQDKKY